MIQRSARGGRARRSHSKPMSEINVTPMVDVMLVLLVIFMVAAPLLTVGVPVQMPETAAQPLPQEQEAPLTITMTADGQLFLQETEVARDTLLVQLTAIAAERTSRKVFVRADGDIPYAQVAQVMGALNAGGFLDIGLVTDAGGPTLTGSDG